MGERLIMNKALGTKWFTFYAKVRPWFAVIVALASIVNFAQYPSVFLNNIGLLIAFFATIAQTVLSIIVSVKSNGDYQDFVNFVKEVLIFETVNMAYQTATQQYYQNGSGIATAVVVGLVLLLVSYLAWYRPNVKYFKRRLILAPMSTQPVNELPQASTTTRTIVQPKKVTHSSTAKASRYCSRCGNIVDPTTKKCTGCGKQYFKGFSWKTFLVVLEVLFVISFAANIVLFLSNTELQNDIASLEREKTVLEKEKTVLETENKKLEGDVASLKKSKETYYSFYEKNHDKLELLDSWVVFVENDGSRLYHKYECKKFVGEDCWAHNIEYAKYLGYKPCPLCFD